MIILPSAALSRIFSPSAATETGAMFSWYTVSMILVKIIGHLLVTVS